MTRLCLQPRRDPDLLDRAVRGKVRARGGRRALARPGVRPSRPTTKSRKWSVKPRPTWSSGFGSPLFSHSRGVSIGPAASTTTCASSVVAPVRVFRQVTPRARPPSVSTGPRTHPERRDRLAARPRVGRERHRHVARVGRALRPQIARRLQRQEAALRTVAAERAALRTRIDELLRLVRPPGRPSGCRIAFSCGRTRHARCPWTSAPAGQSRWPREELLLLGAHRRGLDRKRVLDPS